MCNNNNNNRDLINQRVSWLVKIFTRVLFVLPVFRARVSNIKFNILGTRSQTSCLSSATRPSGCSVRPHRRRSWPSLTTWTIPRRFGWPVGCVSVRFWTFCCLWKRSRRVRELPPLSIPTPRLSRPGRRRRRGWRICQPWGIFIRERRV